MQSKLLAQEVMKLREGVSKQKAEKDRYRDALIKIKNSFYQTNVFNQLKDAAANKKGADLADESRSTSTTLIDSKQDSGPGSTVDNGEKLE